MTLPIAPKFLGFVVILREVPDFSCFLDGGTFSDVYFFIRTAISLITAQADK